MSCNCLSCASNCTPLSGSLTIMSAFADVVRTDAARNPAETVRVMLFIGISLCGGFVNAALELDERGHLVAAVAEKALLQQPYARWCSREDVQVLRKRRQVEAVKTALPVLALDQHRVPGQGEHVLGDHPELCRGQAETLAVVFLDRLVVPEQDHLSGLFDQGMAGLVGQHV